MSLITLVLLFSYFASLSVATSGLELWSFDLLNTKSHGLPVSTCSNIFQYDNDGPQWYGTIKIVIPEISDEIKLLVGMSYEAHLATTNKAVIELVDKKHVADNIFSGKPITYKITFPLLMPLPKITRIILNGNRICIDDQGSMANIAETIYIDYTIKVKDHIFYGNGHKHKNEPVNDPKFEITTKSLTRSKQKIPTNQMPIGQPSKSTKNNYKETSTIQAFDTFIPDDSVNLLGNNKIVNESNLEKQATRDYLGTLIGDTLDSDKKEEAETQYLLPLKFFTDNYTKYDIRNKQLRRQRRQSVFQQESFREYPSYNEDIFRQYEDNFSRSEFQFPDFNINPTNPDFSNFDSEIEQYSPSFPTGRVNDNGIQRSYNKMYTYTVTYERNDQNNGNLPITKGGTWTESIITNSDDYDNETTTADEVDKESTQNTDLLPPRESSPYLEKPFRKPILEDSPPPRPQSTSSSYECGSIKATPLFKNGKVTRKGDWPWVVAIFLNHGKNNLQFRCGGTLISHRHVVTAAHCVKNANNIPLLENQITVIPGVFNIHAWKQESDAQLRNVMKIVSHPQYSGNERFLDDIAVIILDEIVQFSNYIIPICLWQFDTDHALIVGKNGTVVGWGRDENSEWISPEPREGEVPIVSTNTCKESNDAFHQLTSDTTICAGARNGAGPCHGDSGGGMYIPVNKRWYLRGILSISTDPECVLKDFIVYTDTSKYLNFLQDIMNQYP